MGPARTLVECNVLLIESSGEVTPYTVIVWNEAFSDPMEALVVRQAITWIQNYLNDVVLAVGRRASATPLTIVYRREPIEPSAAKAAFKNPGRVACLVRDAARAASLAPRLGLPAADAKTFGADVVGWAIARMPYLFVYRPDRQDFRTWPTVFSNALLHELGHTWTLQHGFLAEARDPERDVMAHFGWNYGGRLRFLEGDVPKVRMMIEQGA